MNKLEEKKRKKITSKKKAKDKKGFTLIELLAVIIILGVLLLIAVPSISKYIENSRKNTYINSVKSLVSAVSTSVNALEYPFTISKNEGLIIPFSEINLEKKSAKTQSPYSKYISEKSYVLVAFDGESYRYYVSAFDDAGYAIPLVYDKNLSINSITTDISKINYNIISYEEIINKGKNAVFDTEAVTMSYLKHNDKIIKVKIGYSVYKKGDVIQLKDGSKWFATQNSTIDDERINLVSYYSMATVERNYGKQDSSNPKISFDSISRNDTMNKMIQATEIELIKNKINVSGATIKMPELEDFGCTISECNAADVPFFKNSENVKFWTLDVDKTWSIFIHNTDGIGRSTSNSLDCGMRLVIKDLLKSNVDKQATKALN